MEYKMSTKEKHSEEREEGEIIDEFEDIISSDEEFSMRQRIKELEAKNAELEKIENISGVYGNEGYDFHKKNTLCYQTDRYPLISIDISDEDEYPPAPRITKHRKSHSSSRRKMIGRRSSTYRHRKQSSSPPPAPLYRQSDKHLLSMFHERINALPSNSSKRKRKGKKSYSTKSSRKSREYYLSESDSDYNFDGYYEDVDDSYNNITTSDADRRYSINRDELRVALARNTESSDQHVSLKDRLIRRKENTNTLNDKKTQDLQKIEIKTNSTEEKTDTENNLEEQELRIIALKSAVIRKHLDRKKRNENLAYSPTDFDGNYDNVTVSPSIHNIDDVETCMEISPVPSPKTFFTDDEQIDTKSVDMEIANSDSDCEVSCFEKWVPIEQIPLPGNAGVSGDVYIPTPMRLNVNEERKILPQKIVERSVSVSPKNVESEVEEEEIALRALLLAKLNSPKINKIVKEEPISLEERTPDRDTSLEAEALRHLLINNMKKKSKLKDTSAVVLKQAVRRLTARNAFSPVDNSLTNALNVNRNKNADDTTAEIDRALCEMSELKIDVEQENSKSGLIINVDRYNHKKVHAEVESNNNLKENPIICCRGDTKGKAEIYCNDVECNNDRMNAKYDKNISDVVSNRFLSAQQNKNIQTNKSLEENVCKNEYNEILKLCSPGEENTTQNPSTKEKSTATDQNVNDKNTKPLCATVQDKQSMQNTDVPLIRIVDDDMLKDFNTGSVMPNQCQSSNAISAVNSEEVEQTVSKKPNALISITSLPEVTQNSAPDMDKADVKSKQAITKSAKIIVPPLILRSVNKKISKDVPCLTTKIQTENKDSTHAPKKINSITQSIQRTISSQHSNIFRTKIIKPNKVINQTTTATAIKRKQMDFNLSTPVKKSKNEDSVNRLITSAEVPQVKQLIIQLRASETESEYSEYSAEDYDYDVDEDPRVRNLINENSNIVNEYYDIASPISLPMESPCDTPSRVSSPMLGSVTPLLHSTVEKSIVNDIFEAQLDQYLKNVRSKVTYNTAQEEAPMVALLNTPIAVRHLPAASQQEYRRLIKRMKTLERQKQAKNVQIVVKNVSSTSLTETDSVDVGKNLARQVLIKNSSVNTTKPRSDKSTEHAKSSQNLLQNPKTLENEKNDPTVNQVQSLSQKSAVLPNNCIKSNQLQNYETSYRKMGTSIISKLDKNIELVMLTKNAKMEKLKHEFRLRELQKEMEEVQRQLQLQKDQITRIYPEICDFNRIIESLKTKRAKINKAGIVLGKSLSGPDYSMSDDQQSIIISQKSKKLVADIKYVNKMKLSDIYKLENLNDRRPPEKDSTIVTKSIFSSDTSRITKDVLDISAENKGPEVHNENLPQKSNVVLSTTEAIVPNIDKCVLDIVSNDEMLKESTNEQEQEPSQFNSADDNEYPDLNKTKETHEEEKYLDGGTKLHDYVSPLSHIREERQLNPNGIVCPYQLMGQCDDKDCKYMHLDDSYESCKKVKEIQDTNKESA